jgi:hypothetical protein
MNANDVLIDFLEDNRRRLHRLFDVISDECLFWKPEAEANNIAVTVWHMARILDVYLTQQVKGWASEEECWFRQGWAGVCLLDTLKKKWLRYLNLRRSKLLDISMMFTISPRNISQSHPLKNSSLQASVFMGDTLNISAFKWHCLIISGI